MRTNPQHPYDFVKQATSIRLLQATSIRNRGTREPKLGPSKSATTSSSGDNAEIKFVPRTGERIFIPLEGAGDWDSYTVVAVEYFLVYDPSTGEPSRSVSKGIERITLYAPSRAGSQQLKL